MENEINVPKFYITIAGDTSVGIPDQHFELGSDFNFESNTELNYFIDGLREIFEETFDAPVSIIREDEFIKQEMKQEEIARKAEEADMNFIDDPISDEEMKIQIRKDWSDD